MIFTIEDIRKAFRAGKNSNDKYAKQKGFARNEVEYTDRLVKNSSLGSVVVQKDTFCENCQNNYYTEVDGYFEFTCTCKRL